ncbi:MAG: protein kinase [Planctomycetes bacterium]|nr:protein kinase [Planctomycetota bacterium]
MCDVSASEIRDLLLATMTAPESKESGARARDLLAAAGRQHVCSVHSLCTLRELHRSGHASPEGAVGAEDPVSDPDSRWRITAAREAMPRRRVGNYTYSPSDELGHGRLGIVFRGRNEFLHRDVAMKFLSRDYTRNEDFRQKFEREARILAHLDHPNIVKVYDGGQDADGTYYIAMEYIEGGTLVQLAKRTGRLSPPLVAEYMCQVADALAAARRHGILHRDVKPDNVMMTPSGAKLADFNLAAIEDSALMESPSTFGAVASEEGKVPQLVGTLAYMSPERTNGQRGDHRSDIYSLGATFYAVATRQYLFENVSNGTDAYMNWRWHHNKETPEPLTGLVPGFPPDLAAIVHRCLAKDPGQRYQTYEEILEDLAHVRGGPADGVKAAPLPSVQAPRKARRRRAFLICAVLLLALIATVLLADPFARGPKPPAKKPAVAKTPQRDYVEGRPADHKTEETRKLGLDSTKKAPKPKPISKSLAEQMAAYDPTADDLTLLRQILDLAARERPRFMARSYGAFRKGVDDLEGQAPPPTEGERTYRAWNLKAARDLAELAEFAVSNRLADLTTPGRTVSLVLADGQKVSGEVKEADGEAIVVATDSGRVRVPLANLAPSNFTGNVDFGKASLAFQTLSGSATDALDQILAKLPASEDLLLWIPPAVRLAHEEARAFAIRRDFGRSHELFDRLANLQSRIPSVFGHLQESDFKAICGEREALKLFVDERFAEVATRYPKSLAYAPATEEILACFCARLLDDKELLKKLAAADPAIEKAVDDQRPKPEDIYERKKAPPKRRLFDFVGGPACIDWTAQPPDGKGERWDRQGREKPAYIILRHPTDLQRLIYHGPVASALEGVILVYRFIPVDLSARWRLGLESGGSTRLYFQAARDAVEIYQPALGDGILDRQIAQGKIEEPPDTQTWRTLALVPVATEEGGVLLAYVDGNPRPVLRVSLKEARIPEKPLLGVFHGELHIKNLIAPFTGEK